MNKSFSDRIQESIETKQAILADADFLATLQKVCEVTSAALKDGKKVLVAGNGGSAGDSQHFTAELVGRYVKKRRGLPAIALTVDSSFLTAWCNDYAYETVFSRHIA